MRPFFEYIDKLKSFKNFPRFLWLWFEIVVGHYTNILMAHVPILCLKQMRWKKDKFVEYY